MLTSSAAPPASTPSPTSPPSPSAKDPRALIAIAAAAAPPLLAYNVAPSPTLLNQVLAVGLWGWFVAVLAVSSGAGVGAAVRRAASLLAALGVVALAVLWSWGPGLLPSTFALSALGLLVAAAVMVTSGAHARAQGQDRAAGPPRADAVTLFAWFCLGWVVVGAFNVLIALVQVFAPEWAEGHVIARSALPGRATGNLRQPNHLASLLMWSAIAVVALLELRRIAWPWAAGLMAALVFAVLLSGSRTGLVGVVLLALWALADRKLARPSRGLLLAAPALYALAWWGMSLWAGDHAQRFGGVARLQEADLSSSRFGIWSNTLALIRDHPWTGVGFGEFNLAWTLTPLPGRPTALFDHTHNLPLQLAVELGLPLATLVMGLLLWALWRAGRSAWTTAGEAGSAQRAAFAMVAMIGLHSLLEYPLWYSYFLLPAAWAWGWALGLPPAGASAPARRHAWPLLGAGVALVAAAALTLVDYLRVVAIFQPRAGVPLTQRIDEGRKSVLFGHHGDYAAATAPWREASLLEFGRTTHHLLDARLMMAWAQALARAGRWDEARYVAARLAEFRNPQAEALFAPCAGLAAANADSAAQATPRTASAPPAILCDPPRLPHRWQDLAALTQGAGP